MTHVSLRSSALAQIVVLASMTIGIVVAEDRPSTSTTAPKLLARVGLESIYDTDVALEIASIHQRRKLAEEEIPVARRALREQLVKQRLVLIRLSSEKLIASDREIDAAVKSLVRRLEARGVALNDHLAESKSDEPALRRQLKWQLSWQRALEHYLTDEQLEKYFTRYRRDFDGTQRRVAHILWKVSLESPEAQWVEQEAAARQVRAEIEEGRLSFAEAAKKYSNAPTAADGGDVGFIRRFEPMPETFSKVAFSLEEGKLSPPVRSASGVHLIRLVEEKPGTKTLNDVLSDVRRAATQYLFDWLAERQRPQTNVEVMN